MDILLPKHYTEYRQRIRKFAESEVLPVALEQDAKEEFPVFLAKRMGEMGLFGITLPKEYGGQGLDTLSYIIAVEELARIDSSPAATVAAHNSLGIEPIFAFGTDEQKQYYLPRLTTGEQVWGFGLTEENAGSDARGVETEAKLTDDNWVINGNKRFITNSSSEISGGVTLLTITDHIGEKKEISSILVDRGSPGYYTEPVKGKLVWRAIDNGNLRFEDCRVPQKNLLGRRGEGMKVMVSALNGGRLSIGAVGLGLAQGAYERAVDYAKKRIQFGKPIVENQAIRFKLAEIAMKIEAARSLLYNACRIKDAGEPYAKEAAMAKLYCSDVAEEAARESIQIHGAYGLLHENHIERFYRDQRLLHIGEGTSEIMKLIISHHILR